MREKICGLCRHYWPRIWNDRQQNDGYCKINNIYPVKTQDGCPDYA